MKIIISESQHKLLVESNIDEERFKKAAFSIWNKMKKNGERPGLIDIIYDLIDAQRHTYRDYEVVRPIWYEYNGGFDVLAEKVENEILGKTFVLKTPNPGLDTKFRVKEVNLEQREQFPNQIIDVICEVDKGGMIDYETYDDEVGQVFLKRDTIEQALYELEYEQEDLKEYLRGEIYNILEPLTDEKYGVPIHVDIEYSDFN